MTFLKSLTRKDKRSRSSKPTKSQHEIDPYPKGKYSSISDSDSERTWSNSSSYGDVGSLASKQEKMAKHQISKHDIDGSSSKTSLKSRQTSKSTSTTSSTDSSGKQKQKKKLKRWFDLSSLATPIAVYNLPADFNGDDPNVYWDEDAKVWRYWYYTWCPIF